ncbi:hypothetical protein DPEC_G00367400 [Dallia pectoralis]|nr:hypothetical protein DPEC_G00367400 [Dallia pectoralis]
MTPATVTEGQTVTLTCITSCTLTDGPRNPSVSVSPSGEIVEGSLVTLTCSSDANPPVYNYTWYKKNVTSPKASGQSYSITNIRSEDSGEYYCVAENGIGSNNSTDLMITVVGTQSSQKIPLVIYASVGITVVVLVLMVLCLSGFIWFRKKTPKTVSDTRINADSGQGISNPTFGNIYSVGETSENNDQQDDLEYINVNFDLAKTQDVSLNATVQPTNQDEEVQYAAVKFNPPSAATKPMTGVAEEESPVLYSTVNTPRTNI